ncbi:hypothetical protein ASPZODRAFT_148958 [Penicilliopsis zonata CBS 506.65]|uniref:NADP-dependent oxidoreductase domain-containing protein n=1 Tax=Penicilliopsis zonata CBS 506.65 TaxID=1073090 RepID=A0A1L9SXA9_9EURO|nr:hypothetical protein ASPZODRAFT_148958 [Penicilliopsis zonata CBS 506.65]OJJ51731.1 hypothetical protein ASPZODRAFT_148958 [Penicilliopsis zonata CBS 506.65]
MSLVNRPIGPIGFGLMGLTWRPNPVSYDEACAVMKRALELGANFWNAGEFYGPPEANSLQLLRHYFTRYPEDRAKVVLSVKGGIGAHGPDGSAAGIKASVANCLRLLEGTKEIDIFEPARVDPQTPIETTVAALADEVHAGRIRAIGLSECSAATVRRAAAVHPIASVEVELSLFSTDPLSNGVAACCAALQIPLVAYSPLSRGWLTGTISSLDDLPADSMLRQYPRFQPEVFDLNLKLVDALRLIAARKRLTLPQVAIAWVKAHSEKSPDLPLIIPIPGCTTVARVEENLARVDLDDADMQQIADILDRIPVHGGRYGGFLAALMDG